MEYTIKNITYENPAIDGSRHWSDIMHLDECIGALCEIEKGPLSDIDEMYQLLAPESEANLGDYSYPSEDSGFIFLVFNSIENLISYKNKKVA